MSNLAIRTDNKAQKTLAQNPDWNAIRVMRDLFSWDPFREMEGFTMTEARTFMPRFEILANQDNYLFRADLPGVKESDVNISLTGNRLVIAGKREFTEEQKDATYYVYERSYGEFSRAFTLPEGADTEHMTASLAHGVLSLVIPKKPGAQTKQIPVTTPKAKS